MIASANSPLDGSVLVLNMMFMAVHVVSVRRAFLLLCKELAEVVSLDLRPGGASRMTFHGPNGESFPNDGVYLELVPDRKIVFTDAFGEGWIPQGKPMFVGEITFEDAGNGETLYTARARHWTPEAAKKHVEMGFHQGWGICAEQLEATAREL